MAAPREAVFEPLPAGLPTPAAWLLGYVRTDVPGYREVEVGGGLYVAPSGEYRFDALVADIGGVTDVTWSETATLGVSGVGGIGDAYPDRLGWLLGAMREVGGSDPYEQQLAVPPAAIPLMGATWTQVRRDSDRRQILDEHRRNQGYVWGAALIWQCKLKMHRWALQALETGWCLRGKVTLGCVGMLDTPASASEPQGAITGYVLAPVRVSWIDGPQTVAEVEIYIATE